MILYCIHWAWFDLFWSFLHHQTRFAPSHAPCPPSKLSYDCVTLRSIIIIFPVPVLPTCNVINFIHCDLEQFQSVKHFIRWFVYIVFWFTNSYHKSVHSFYLKYCSLEHVRCLIMAAYALFRHLRKRNAYLRHRNWFDVAINGKSCSKRTMDIGRAHTNKTCYIS